MKSLKRVLYVSRIPVGLFALGIILCCIASLLVKCSKHPKMINDAVRPLDAFVKSATYQDFISKNADLGKQVNTAAARVVPINKTAAMVHIPVMQKHLVMGAIIGLPADSKGGYELLYQDNTAALSGTGNIYVYTSARELFHKIELLHGKIVRIVPQNLTGTNTRTAYYEEDADNCRFWCRLSKCYTAVKARFPTEPICDLLDIFFGVCSSATVTTCLIRMAIK